MSQLSPASRLKRILSEDARFVTALTAVRAVSKGKIWLIGSAVYKNLISDIHGNNLSVKDYDFIVEERIASKLKGWKSSRNFWDCLKLSKKNIVIDVVALDELISVQKMGKKKELKSYLWQTPFSIQSIAYNVDSHRLVGSGIKDIKKGFIRVNNQVRYDQIVEHWGTDRNLKNTAKKIGLKS